jgi:hypothetical protein
MQERDQHEYIEEANQHEKGKLKDTNEFVKSPFPNFSKKQEGIVLKGKLYKIQSISPKKLVLKIHATAPNGMDEDGIYCLKHVAEEYNDKHKV